MLGKSKGRIVHCSDFIGPEGRIIIRDSDRIIIQDARKIIYLGAGRDPW